MYLQSLHFRIFLDLCFKIRNQSVFKLNVLVDNVFCHFSDTIKVFRPANKKERRYWTLPSFIITEKDFLKLVLPSFIAAEKIEHHALHTTVYLIVKQNIYIYVCMYQL